MPRLIALSWRLSGCEALRSNCYDLPCVQFLSYPDPAHEKTEAILKISWNDVERATTEGIFIVDGKSIAIDNTAIELWRKHPNTIFETKSPDAPNTDRVDFLLADPDPADEDRKDLGIAFQSCPPQE